MAYENTKSILKWVRVVVTYEDLAAAALTNTIVIGSLPPKHLVHHATFIRNTTFSGGAISNYSISIGIPATPTKYLSSTTVFSGAAFGAMSTGPFIESITASTDIVLRATSVGANLDAATQGEVEIWYLVSSLA